MSHPNEQKKRAVPIADAPTMRSVLIQRAPSSFEVPSPRPIAIGKLSATAPERKNTPPITNLSSESTWKIQHVQLKDLPPFYPLERTHVFVDNDDCQTVASRIADCLRHESIHAVFHETTALAETNHHIRFCIRLFQQTNDGDKKQVVVELQRRQGCSFLFHEAAQAILRAAQGTPPVKTRSFSVPNRVMVAAAAAQVQQEQGEEREALEMASSLLFEKDRFDSHMLGMDSLVSLTKSATSCCQSKTTGLAQTILCGELLDTLLNLVKCWRMHNVVSDSDYDDEHDLVDPIEEEHFAMMHRSALTVLANCLVALEKSGECQHFLTRSKSGKQLVADDNLLSVLIQELASAEQRPHDACQAARCLKPLLCCSSHDIKMRAMKLGAPGAATAAYEEGLCRHSMLAKESMQLQNAL